MFCCCVDRRDSQPLTAPSPRSGLAGHCARWDIARGTSPPREQLQQFGWLTATISHAGGQLTWHRESILDKAAASHFLALCFSPVASERRGRRRSPRRSEASWGRVSCFCGGKEQKESQESCCKPRQIPPAAAAAGRAMRRQLRAAAGRGRGSPLGSSKPSRFLAGTRLKGNHPVYPFSCL